MQVVASGDGSADITDSIVIDSGSYLDEACTTYTFPFDVSNEYVVRIVQGQYIENFNSKHEYNLNFKFSCSLPSSTSFSVNLVYYDSVGSVLRTQELYSNLAANYNVDWQDVNIDFSPDSSGLSGYKARLEFNFLTTSDAAVICRLSSVIHLSDKDDNSGWFQKIINAINEIPEKLSNLGDTIGTFFSNLRDGLSSDLEDQTEAEGGFFSDLRDKLSAKFEEVGNAISGKFEEISQGFTDFFEKFKPRVYEPLDWTVAFLNASTGQIEYTSVGNAVVTDYFNFSGNSYFIEFHKSLGAFVSCQVFIYDDDLNFISVKNVSPDSEPYELIEGYQYRFRLYQGGNLIDYYGDELDNACNAVVKVYADEGWLNALARLLLNGLSSLFIPGDAEYFEELYEQWTDLYESKFGVFAQTTTLFNDILLKFSELFSGAEGYSFVLPEISFPIGSERFVLIEEQEFDMEGLVSYGFVSDLYYIYQLSVWAIMILCILKYALRVESVVFGSSKGMEFVFYDS